MQGPLQLGAGKPLGRMLSATDVSGYPSSRLFHIKDKNTHTHFLIDTGAEVSVIPLSLSDSRPSPDKLTLTAVSTIIRTFGKCSLTLHRPFSWVFIIAEVKRPILGADFLSHFGLLVDMKQRQLLDTITQLHVPGILSSEPSPGPTIRPKDNSDPYHNLLSNFLLLPKYVTTILLLLTILHTTSRQQGHQCLLDHTIYHLNVSRSPNNSSSTCSNWESCDPPLVHGRHHFTWCPKKQLETDVPVVIIVP